MRHDGIAARGPCVNVGFAVISGEPSHQARCGWPAVLTRTGTRSSIHSRNGATPGRGIEPYAQQQAQLCTRPILRHFGTVPGDGTPAIWQQGDGVWERVGRQMTCKTGVYGLTRVRFGPVEMIEGGR